MVSRIAKFSPFGTEWLGLAGIALLDAMLIPITGLHFRTDAGPFLFVALAIGAAAMVRGLRLEQAGHIAEYVALNVLATPLFGVLTYACMAMSGPWVDAPLLAFDRALGFDWLTWFRFITAHPWLFETAHLAYASIFVQPIYLAVLFGMMRRPDRLRDVFRIMYVALLLSCVGAIFFPALGPFKMFGMEQYGDFLHDVEKLHARADLTFVLPDMRGVIAFPSFHTTLALLYAYGFRRTGAVGYAMMALNGLMLLSIPFMGGHYIADMLGGAAVMLVSLAIVRLPDLARRNGKRDIFAGVALEPVEQRVLAQPKLLD